MVILVLWCTIGNVQGQNIVKRAKASTRHVKGMQGVELGVGVSDIGVFAAGYYSRILKREWYGKIGGSFEVETDDRFENRTISFDVVGARTLILKKAFFFSLMAGPTLVGESIKGFEVEKDIASFGFGLMGGIEAEFYINSRIVLVSNGYMRYVFNSDLGKTRLYAGVGLKYTFKNL